jgi:phosphatidylglycerol:prolipoprotein diacylglycerol transferase
MPFVIDIDPVLIQLGPVAIRWYSLALIGAIAVAFLIARRGTRKAGIPDAILADGAIWVGLAALVGGRVLFEIQNDLPMLAVDPFHVFMVWDGGLSFLGGLIAALIAVVIYARRNGLPVGIVADAAAPAAAIGQAIGHLGCIVTGDSSGIPTTLPWGFIYRNPAAMAPHDIALQPTQAYEAIALAGLFVLLWVGRERLADLGAGASAAVYLVAVAMIRFSLFFLRDEAPVFAGLKTAQLLSVPIGALGLLFLAVLVTRRSNTPRRSQWSAKS